MPPIRWLLTAALPLLGACQSDPPEVPPRLKPLLETVSARYRPLDRQDTLASYWVPDSLLADSLFSFTPAHRSQVLLRVRFVPGSIRSASAAPPPGSNSTPAPVTNGTSIWGIARKST